MDTSVFLQLSIHLLIAVAVAFVVRLLKQSLIVANAYYMAEAEVLYSAGVDCVMMPHLSGGNWIADILKKKVTHKSLTTLREEQGILTA